MSETSFKVGSIEELTFNPFTLISKGWFLVTAGDESAYNTMTASWGGMGIMWNSSVFTTVVRRSRYTYEFMEKSEYYSICFFDEEYRDALKLCGSRSGRNCDKVKEAQLTTEFIDGVPVFKEAKLVFICRKLYGQELNSESVIDSAVSDWYKDNDWHKAYTGSIVKVLTKA